ncbi:Arabinogalactan peptide 22 [Dendrobium catenatum]|uniref:Arabinogalactan peptide 22 n=1 Tax=Dendrobium catenatum TaxID=906689 RepID=A0A2I0VMK3_9ASPA|nr:Arabinogalactan peptide 22 [Dendrobium catenatum]
MSSMKVPALLLMAYFLLSIFLHPCLSLGLQNTSNQITEAYRNDAKAIDQGIAYMLMLIALVLTYLIH